MNELKLEDVMRAFELDVKRHLMPNVDIDGTVSVENAERWFLKLLKEKLAHYISALLREKDAEIERLRAERDNFEIISKDLRFRNKVLQNANEGLAKNVEDLESQLQPIREARAEAAAAFLAMAIAKMKERGELKPFVLVEDLYKIAKEFKEGGENDGKKGIC